MMLSCSECEDGGAFELDPLRGVVWCFNCGEVVPNVSCGFKEVGP